MSGSRVPARSSIFSPSSISMDDSIVELSGLDDFFDPPETFSRMDARRLALEDRIDFAGLIGFEHMKPRSLGEKS